ncbi:MAG: hypothetical protein HDS99_05100 [Bacteroidales bacterium]|nr:hypothetical protein [Bacteroidales bacterium]
MSNKRELKKYIVNTCGALAADMIMTGYIFSAVEPTDVQKIINHIATLQAESLAKCSLSFDKTPRDFETGAQYHKARKQYFAAAYSKLLKDFNAEVSAIVKEMNEAIPEEVKTALKEAAAE